MPLVALLSPLGLGLALGSEPAPLPLLEPEEHLRPSFELSSSVGAGVPSARRSGATLPAGSEVGVTALYRGTPYFAVGVGVRLNAFPVLPAESKGGSAVFAGAVGRLYFRERGAEEPYFELGLGMSSLRATHRIGARRTRDSSDLEATARAAIGIDFWLGRSARLGPHFGYTRYSRRAAERCTELGCASFPAEQADLPASVLSLGISLTFGAGDPL